MKDSFNKQEEPARQLNPLCAPDSRVLCRASHGRHEEPGKSHSPPGHRKLNPTSVETPALESEIHTLPYPSFEFDNPPMAAIVFATDSRVRYMELVPLAIPPSTRLRASVIACNPRLPRSLISEKKRSITPGTR